MPSSLEKLKDTTYPSKKLIFSPSIIYFDWATGSKFSSQAYCSRKIEIEPGLWTMG